MFFALRKCASFFEQLARTTLHAGVKVLRKIRKIPATICQIGLNKSALEFFTSLFKQISHSLSNLFAGSFKRCTFIRFHYWKIRLVITLARIPSLPLFRFAQEL